jgi:hypothetical protein
MQPQYMCVARVTGTKRRSSCLKQRKRAKVSVPLVGPDKCTSCENEYGFRRGFKELTL